jgi:hypothetical protein
LDWPDARRRARHEATHDFHRARGGCAVDAAGTTTTDIPRGKPAAPPGAPVQVATGCVDVQSQLRLAKFWLLGATGTRPTPPTCS